MLWLLWFTFILLLLKMLARSSFIEYELHNLMRVLEHLNEVKTHQHDDSENIWKKAWLLISKAESMGILNKIECHLSLMWHFTDDKVSPFGGIPKKYPMTHKNGKEWTNVLDMHELLHTTSICGMKRAAVIPSTAGYFLPSPVLYRRETSAHHFRAMPRTCSPRGRKLGMQIFRTSLGNTPLRFRSGDFSILAYVSTTAVRKSTRTLAKSSTDWPSETMY